MIVFKSVKSKNFFSIGNNPIEIQLDKSPTTVISGENGAGKSVSILDSITFALFGKPFRAINIPNVINSITGSGCEVQLEFRVGKKDYKIIRGLKPNIFEIYEDGKLIPQDANKRDYQDRLETHILGGLKENVFKQVVVVGSADYKPFMQLAAAERREIVEELLDIKIFSAMLELVKSKLSGLKEELKDLDYSIDLTKDKLKILLENKKKMKEEAKIKKEGIKEKIDQEEVSLKALTASVSSQIIKKSELLAEHDKKQETEKELTKNNKQFSALENIEETLSNSLKFFENNEQCPTCHQSITDDHKNCMVTDTKSKLKDTLKSAKDLAKIIDSQEKKISVFNLLRKKIEEIEKSIFKSQAEIQSKQKYIADLKESMTAVSSINETLEEDQKKLETEFGHFKQKRLELLETRQYYEVISSMLKDGGIKTKIIRQYIPLINKVINEYLTRFGLPIQFTLDEQFNEVIKSRYRDAFKYASFSEGEKTRINLSLLLAWRDIARTKNTINTNLLILDEIMDSSLDSMARDELLNILMSQGKGTNIFVISHVSSDQLYDKFRSAIHFEKYKNFTQMVVTK